MIRKFILIILSILIIGGMSACNSLQIPEVFSDITKSIEPGAQAKPIEEAEESADAVPGLQSLADLQAVYENVYEMVLPSVVSISVIKTVSDFPSIMPEFPFGDEQEWEFPEYQERGAGSGFVWDTDGHIITNNHVVEGAEVIRVQFSDRTIALGELIGADAASDLAVVKVDVPASELQPIKLTDSTKVKVGQIAIAIGNPFQLDGSMTTGIISGTGRSLPLDQNLDGPTYTIPDIIQTDAPINPGNSGGVLVDIYGRLIGVTTAIESPVRANAGIGYVVPSIIVNKIVPVLINEGSYQQPWIGITGTTLTAEIAELIDLDANVRGALVIEVTPDSPADKAELRGSSKKAKVFGNDVLVGGDVITAVDDIPIDDFEDLVAFLARYANVGQTIMLTILRDGKEIQVPLALQARPSTSTEVQTSPREIQSDAWMGIMGADMTADIAEKMDLKPGTKGVLVQQVTADSPADKAGIRGSYKPFDTETGEILIGGDLITEVDGQSVGSTNALTAAISQYEPGDEVTLTILRDGKEISLKVTLEKRP